MTTKASAYGFTVNPDQHWSHAAGCAQPGTNPEMWFSKVAAVQWHLVAEARHICLRHCPVRELCAKEIGPERGAVVAGVFYNERGLRSEHQPSVPVCARCIRG